MSAQPESLKAVAAILEGQVSTITSLHAVLKTAHAKLDVMSGALAVIVDELREASPVKNETLDTLRRVLADNQSLNGELNGALSNIDQMIELNEKMLAAFKKGASPPESEPFDGLIS